MNRMRTTACVLLTAAALGTATASGVGVAAAQSSTLQNQTRPAPTVAPESAKKPNRAAADLPDVVAVAIGHLKETDGSSAIVDLRAGARDGRAAGTLRLFCPKEGYYNGAVRQLAVKDGVITVSGAGPLIRPDGSRMAVRYTARLSIDSKQVAIVVEGRNGFSYTMEGALSPGMVKAGDPSTIVPQS